MAQSDDCYDTKPFTESVLMADLDAAVAEFERLAEKTGFRRAVTLLVEPMLAEVGKKWTEGSISLAQGYVAGKVAEIALANEAARRSSDDPIPFAGIAVLGNTQDDFHSLGRKMVATFLRISGWTVEDLGNDVPPGEFVDAAVASGARVIGASAMMLSTAMNIRGIRDEIDKRGLSGTIKLAVGGAVFKMRPELIEEVGGDGSCPNAVDAPALFEHLARDAGGTA